MNVDAASIALPAATLTVEQAREQTVARCIRGFFCGKDGAELEHRASLDAGVCCCCRAGTRHHD